MKNCLFYEASRAIFSYFINLMLKSKEGILFASKANNMFMPDVQHFIFTAPLSVGGLPFSPRFPCHFITSSLDHGVRTPGFNIVFYSCMTSWVPVSLLDTEKKCWLRPEVSWDRIHNILEVEFSTNISCMYN